MGAETLRSFPFVDAVVSGEADLISPELVRRLRRSQEVAGLLGVRTRGQIVEAFGARARRHSVPAESIIDRGARRPRESTTDPRR